MNSTDLDNIELFRLYRPLDPTKLVDAFIEATTHQYKAKLFNMFTPETVIQGRTTGVIKFTTSLFAQNHDYQNQRIPDKKVRSLPVHDPDQTQRHLVDHGWVKQDRNWWRTYLQPILEFDDPAIDLEVYVCPLLFEAARSLLPERHTYKVMRVPTIRHNPGAMWRFLGLSSSKPVFNIDSDALPYALPYLKEWEQSKCLWFRKAHCADREINNFSDDSVFYHPMTASEVGLKAGGLPGVAQIRDWLCAFWWAANHGMVQNCVYYPPLKKMCSLFGRNPYGYGFDELFLMQVVFPLAFKKGIFSVFGPSDRRTYLAGLDLMACEKADNHQVVIEGK